MAVVLGPGIHIKRSPLCGRNFEYVSEDPYLAGRIAAGLVEGLQSEVLGPDYRLHRSDGHTPGMLLTEIPGEDGPVVFVADLAPGLPWVRSTITMGYDRCPELLIDEKTHLFELLHERRGRLFFTHDPQHAICSLRHDDRGRIEPRDPQEAVVGLEV